MACLSRVGAASGIRSQIGIGLGLNYLLDREALYFKDQDGVGADGGAVDALAVGKVRWNKKLPV